MKVLLIGPLPQPIDGCSYANEILLKNLAARHAAYSFVNTNTKTVSGKQGKKFSVRKAFSFVRTYGEIYKVFTCSVVYTTPGQTFFGVCKYAPFFVLCRLLRKPYVIHLHGGYMGRMYDELSGIKKKVFGFLVSGAAAGIVLSKSLRFNFEKLLPPGKIYIVENFVDSGLAARPLTKNHRQLRILYLSNLIREKGILELLDALILLKQKKTDFHVTVAGVLDEDLKNEVNGRFQVLAGQMEYAGVVTGDKKAAVLGEANVFVLPTYYEMEGQPISLLEAMAAGNIIVTTAHAGIPDIVSEANGFFVKEKSPEEIASCLQNIQLNLSSMIGQFSAHNKEYAAGMFTEKNFTEKILTILHANAKA